MVQQLFYRVNCSDTFVVLMQSHWNWVHDMLYFQMECNKCGKLFKRNYDCKRHEATCRQKVDQHVCEMCHNVFDHKYNRLRHQTFCGKLPLNSTQDLELNFHHFGLLIAVRLNLLIQIFCVSKLKLEETGPER